MDLKLPTRAWKVPIISFLIFLLSACSYFPWLKGENRAYKKLKEKALVGQEVVIIDGEEYVKIALEGKESSSHRTRYRYIPVDEYVAKQKEISSEGGQETRQGREPFHSVGKATNQTHGLSGTSSGARDKKLASPSIELKRKIIVIPFTDQKSREGWGEMIAEQLRNSLENRTDRVLCLDDRAVMDYLRRRGIGSVRLDNPMVTKVANTVFGVHALLWGSLAGPYVTASSGVGETREDSASAIVRIEVELVEAATNRVLKSFEKRNSIFETEERGQFSRDKAKLKAINLTMGELTEEILREIEKMEWYTRIVQIDGGRVYLNAGRLTGLKVGDLMDVYEPGGGMGEQMAGIAMDHVKSQRKGRLRVTQLFGTDAAMADITAGGNLALSDVVRPTGSGEKRN
jgi:hypothetical protein